jgi:hypothetical protein
MATIQEVYDSLKEFREENGKEHEEVFNRLRKVELRHAEENGFAKAREHLHKRDDEPVPHPHARLTNGVSIFHPSRWRELGMALVLGALGGERLIALIQRIFTSGPTP